MSACGTNEPLLRKEKVTFTYEAPSVAFFEGLRMLQPMYATGGVPATTLMIPKAPPSDPPFGNPIEPLVDGPQPDPDAPKADDPIETPPKKSLDRA